ncbi:MAG: bifunctional phosphoglucose/phosphomannose isomerase [Candidatus Omnitrophica bacterium]|nr:bifunctional phosphoglucose/phosphomannose isomerase [Candidatus Omnitrophota bacterium]
MPRPLDDPDQIQAIDSHGMLGLLSAFPEQCAHGIQMAGGLSFPPHYADSTCMVVAGVGGSAIGGDLLRSYLVDRCPVSLEVSRHYFVPAYVGSKTLVVVSSYSGETEESLSSYAMAQKQGANLVVLTTGGRLGDQAAAEGVPMIKLPSGLPARAALGYSFFGLLAIAEKMGWARPSEGEIAETVQVLSRLRDEQLGPEVANTKNRAKILAEALKGRLPVIYADADLSDGVVSRWKTQLAENAKVLAMGGTFPEINHNDIVGWGGPSEVAEHQTIVLLRDREERARIRTRIEISKRLWKSLDIEVLEVWSTGQERLSRMFSLIYTGDFASTYLALLNGMDPTDVSRIDSLKSELGSWQA